MNTEELFIAYALETAATSEELTGKESRQKNDRAMTRLHELMRHVMYAAPDRCADTALHLMEHPDARVRLNAAAYCLQAEVHHQAAVELLQRMSQDDPEELVRLNAELTVMCCEPFSAQEP